jgi:nucleosome binding factor SPN SPT16 subunit
VPIEILIQAKAKEASTNALPKFIEAYSKYTRVATLIKETYHGKLITEWNQGIDSLKNKPEQVDMAPALSTVMSVKDEDELVSTDYYGVMFNSHVALPENHPHGCKPDIDTAHSPHRTQARDHSRQRSQDHA